MIDKMNKSLKRLSVPGIRVFANRVAELADGINFTIGEPDFSTPEQVKQAGINAIENNLTGYSHNAGLLELRKEVSSYFKDTYGFCYDPESEVIITNGASDGIDSIFRAILQAGDEVILPAPIYSGYHPLIHFAGGETVYLDTTKTNFLPDPDELESLITKQTKAVVFNYPSNPTGMTMNKERMDELVAMLKKHDIFIISDEIYSENSFNVEHTSFASYEEISDQLFLVHGLSKSHAMTGWRIGYVLGPENLINQVSRVHSNSSICAATPSQHAAIEALKNCRHAPIEMNQSYIKRRDYVYDRLKEMGFSMTKPSGAFYMFPSIEFTRLTSFEFATQLLETEHVAVVPGSTFSPYGEGFIRISYATSMKNIKEGLDRIERFIDKIM